MRRAVSEVLFAYRTAATVLVALGVAACLLLLVVTLAWALVSRPTGTRAS
jgi:hypothetical protein